MSGDVTPGCFGGKEFLRSGSASSPSYISDGSHEEPTDWLSRRARKEKGYAHLQRLSSEEQLVQIRSKPKKTVFGKLKDKSKEREKDVKGKSRSKSKSSKSKGDADSTLSTPSMAYTRNVFGVPISEALRNDPSYDRVPVPAFVRQCIDYILEYGLSQEGIYRLSPPKIVLDELRTSINAGDEPSFSDAHQAACLLKMFIRELPEPLFTWTLLSKFEESVTTCRSIAECLGRLSELIERLPKPNKYFLAYFFLHLQGIMRKSDENKMTLANLGVILQPLFNVSPALLNVFLQNPQLLFPNVQLKNPQLLFPNVQLKNLFS
ncbi:hypothetical protein M513_00477 [Trichuris suis]|uniref:Rho-GAP domain-containing protein n=1 Tax=Trichuris suis TaxID=68888 RepID=A0A085MNI8_9BILA|nr:hypothetical protein M513_00477 [Trichuris suis]